MPKEKEYVGIDDTLFQSRIVKLARKFQVDEKKFIKEQSRLLARSAARFTPPYVSFPNWHKGASIGTKEDIIQGEWAIYNDIKSIFEVLPDEVIWKEHKRTKGGTIYRYNKPRSPGVIINVYKMHQWHRDNKMSNGRTRRLRKPNVPWVGVSLFNDYVKSQIESAGMAKACFFKASLSFGGKASATPKIKRHLGRANGKGKINKTSKGYEGVMSAKADGIYSLYRILPHLKRDRTVKAEKRLYILAKLAAKKAGFKLR
jgi:hypothetical protein